MPEKRSISLIEYFVIFLLTIFFAGMGWFTILNGGITLRGKSGATSHITGTWAIIIAYSFLGISLLCFSLYCRTKTSGLRIFITTAILLFASASAYLLLK